MDQKRYTSIIGFIFLIIACLHALRLFYGWNVEVDGYTIPLWVSWMAVLLAAVLSYFGFRFSKN